MTDDRQRRIDRLREAGPSWPAVEREIIRRGGYAEFIRRAWHCCEVDPLAWSEGCEQQARHVQAQYEQKFPDLVTNVPPGESKSTIGSIMLAPWVWTIDPTFRFIFTTWKADLTFHHARKVSQVLQSEWYRERWGDVLHRKSSLRFMQTQAGGYRICDSIGGGALGKHCHWFVIDDPVKPPDLDKPLADLGLLERANNYLRQTVPNRLTGSYPRKTLVMQRLHESDPSKQCIDAGWVSLCLPALFEPERKCVTPIGGDWRTEAGQVLNPMRRPRVVLDILAYALGGWDGPIAVGQLQQRPAPPGGLVFQRDSFQHFRASDVPFSSTYSCMSIDCSFKNAAGSDYVAIEIWGALGGKLYCYLSVAERLSFLQTVDKIIELLAEWPVHVVIIEDTANGPAVIETLSQSLHNVEAVTPRGGKIARAHAASRSYRVGNVFHLEGADWLVRKEANLATFPTASHDDDVDATSQAIAWYREQGMDQFLSADPAQWNRVTRGLQSLVSFRAPGRHYHAG